MDGVESLNLFGVAGLYALHIVSAVSGALLATGRLAFTSGFSLQGEVSPRSKITGALLLIGQLLGLFVAIRVGQPSGTLVLAPLAAALVLGWFIDYLVSGGGPDSTRKI